MKKETPFMQLKKAILELKEDYPKFIFWGKIEYFMEMGMEAGREIVNLLDRHYIIERISQVEIDRLSPKELNELGDNKREAYRLTATGVNLAISMINLEYAEKMKKLTIAIFVLGGLTFLLGLNQFLFRFFS